MTYTEPRAPEYSVDLQPLSGVLGDFVLLYLLVAVAVAGVGIVGLLVHIASPMRARYIRMTLSGPVWPLVYAWLILRPPQRRGVTTSTR